jgi:transcription termination factor Rho
MIPLDPDESARPRTTARPSGQSRPSRRRTTDRRQKRSAIPAGERNFSSTRPGSEEGRRSVLPSAYGRIGRTIGGEETLPEPEVDEQVTGQQDAQTEDVGTQEVGGPHIGSRRHRRGGDSGASREEGVDEVELSLEGKDWFTVNSLHQMAFPEILKIADSLGIPPQPAHRKEQLIADIVATNSPVSGGAYGEGVLDMTGDGYGFLRSALRNYRPDKEDIYVSASQVRRLNLQPGDTVCGLTRPPRAKERYPALVKVFKINDQDPKYAVERTPFDQLTPLFPDSRYMLETDRDEQSMRIVDMLAPLGMGQRGLIVAPPRTGKTVLLQKIATAIKTNAPDTIVLILLIDERPEEVTDMISHVPGEVIASTFDETPERHAQISDLIIDKARRLVEYHHNVVIVLDSITRLGRAFNALAPQGGKIMSGGVESAALQKPRRFFGSARNVEEGGSLTIVATALIETGSRMDDVIFEEFKGTGNMELHLDRYLAERRIFPAINIDKSGTRKEELLLHPDELRKVWALRKGLSGRPPVEAMQLLLRKVNETQSNAEFLMSLVL